MWNKQGKHADKNAETIFLNEFLKNYNGIISTDHCEVYARGKQV